MSANNSVYLRVARGFTSTLSTVKDGQWQNRTPCVDWDVTDLVEHVVATHQRVYTLINADGIEGFDSDALLTARWIFVLRAYQEVLNDADMANQLVQSRAGEQPFSELIEGLLMIDTLCHTWDLAKAAGSDEALDADAVTIAHAKLLELGAAIRVPGGFQDPVPPRLEVDAQTRFLNYAGRIV
ncbi:MAG TPA: TIGR03086 family metal-binding protein [Acidimicrobiales bacterium]|nr:TIGR03086 family metal-binding protein [Acidimicrobiales bacterium]